MSADVETIYFYGASCDECLEAFGPDESESAAEDWAANHNAENHEPDDRADEAYDRERDARYDYKPVPLPRPAVDVPAACVGLVPAKDAPQHQPEYGPHFDWS